MFANVTGLNVGELVHVIADAHIYDRHVPIAKHMIEDLYPETEYLPIASMMFNHHDNFYDYTIDDFALINYDFIEDIKKIPVAV